METLTKPKIKRSSAQITQASHYEFTSLNSVDECVFQLKVFRVNYERHYNPPFWNIARFRFDDLENIDGITHFAITADTGRLLIKGKAYGCLLPQSDNKTLVKLEIGYVWPVIIHISITLFFNLIFLIYISSGGLLASLVIDTLLIFLPLASAASLKKNLYRTIYTVLTAPVSTSPSS